MWWLIQICDCLNSCYFDEKNEWNNNILLDYCTCVTADRCCVVAECPGAEISTCRPATPLWSAGCEEQHNSEPAAGQGTGSAAAGETAGWGTGLVTQLRQLRSWYSFHVNRVRTVEPTAHRTRGTAAEAAGGHPQFIACTELCRRRPASQHVTISAGWRWRVHSGSGWPWWNCCCQLCQKKEAVTDADVCGMSAAGACSSATQSDCLRDITVISQKRCLSPSFDLECTSADDGLLAKSTKLFWDMYDLLPYVHWLRQIMTEICSHWLFRVVVV